MKLSTLTKAVAGGVALGAIMAGAAFGGLLLDQLSIDATFVGGAVLLVAAAGVAAGVGAHRPQPQR